MTSKVPLQTLMPGNRTSFCPPKLNEALLELARPPFAMVRLPSLQREPSPFPPATSPYAHPRRNPYRSHHPHLHPAAAAATGRDGNGSLADLVALQLTTPNVAEAQAILQRVRRKRRWSEVRRVLAAASVAGAVLSLLRVYYRQRRNQQQQEYVLVDATTSDRGSGGDDDDDRAPAAVSVATAARMLAERVQRSLWAVAVALVRYSIQNARLIMSD